jgi:hypothetical protein
LKNTKVGQLKNPFEKHIWDQLLSRKRKTYVASYEAETLEYISVRRYLPDFILVFSTSGHKRYIETKGYFRPEDRKKIEAIKKTGVDIRLIFMKDQKIYKKGKITYTMWCDKHSIPWAIGNMPSEWYKE